MTGGDSKTPVSTNSLPEMTDKHRHCVIVWFRQDLRLGDNPAFAKAASSGLPLLPVYILDDENAGAWAMGAASRWWLHRSLVSLSSDLDGALRCFRGPADTILPHLARHTAARAIYANRCAEPWQRDCDARVGRELERDGIAFESFVGATLFDPERVSKADGTPYRVFTPFYRKGCLGSAPMPREPLGRPSGYETLRTEGPLDDAAPGSEALAIDALQLVPDVVWYEGLEREWRVGEAAAHGRLESFLESGLEGYAEGRNRPDLRHVSRLSPHLHFGEISPNQVWHAVLSQAVGTGTGRDADTFLSELGWREFSRYLLWHFPTLPDANLQKKFDRFPWERDGALLERWQRGETGYPMVDAGMRELWQTGYMHNRVRMIVGSFLVKNLLQDWREGERWFWDTLCDADLANNSASWQWVAGTGADAAPYFRIFNPVTQGGKFDPAGDYVLRFVPELAAIPREHLHAPWRAPASARRGIAYPDPVVELEPSRERALATFRALSTG